MTSIRLFIICGILFLTTIANTRTQAQTKDARTGSARAAYGQSVPFQSHMTKNKKAKKKAKKRAKNKELRNTRQRYHRGLPI